MLKPTLVLLCFFHSGSPAKILSTFLISLMRTTCSIHLLLLDPIPPLISDAEFVQLLIMQLSPDFCIFIPTMSMLHIEDRYILIGGHQTSDGLCLLMGLGSEMILVFLPRWDWELNKWVCQAPAVIPWT